MTRSIVSFILVIAIILLLCFTAVWGFTIGNFQIPSAFDEKNGIRRGLDLVGGSVITFEAQIQGDIDAETLKQEMNSAMAMLRQRLTTFGYTEAQLYKNGDRRITVEIPAISNPEQAIEDLGPTAQLQFLDSDGNVVLSGSDIKSAKAQVGVIDSSNIQKNYVSLTLNADAVDKFAAATKAAAGKESGKNYISIVLDNEPISQPTVGSEYASTGIQSEDVMISGSMDAKEAGRLASLISIGQLPFSLKDVELRAVGPQLGEKALETSLIAGLIGLILVAIFMMIYYRLPGIVSVIALLLYTALVFVLLAIFRVNLSLPGIAGIILSVGMAVDANVVIFERIKEELRSGKTIKSAIDAGFKRAFTAILDSNTTTFIAALVLYFFGTGPLVGFAITLGLGIIVSMFTALTVTHFLLNRMVDFKIKNIKAYGA